MMQIKTCVKRGRGIQFRKKKVPATQLLNIWLAQNQDNMSEWSDMSIRIMLFQ
jgi:hypothetical protein